VEYVNGNGNNLAKRDINVFNIFGLLKPSQKNIKIVAIVNHGWIAGLVFFIGVLIFIFLAEYTNYSYLLVPASVATMLFVLAATVLSKWIMERLSWYHVEYFNAEIKIDGRSRKFYSEITDIEIKRGVLNSKLYVYGINPDVEFPRPYMLTVTFMLHSEAKYVYNSFWDSDRISEYRKRVLDGNNT